MASALLPYGLTLLSAILYVFAFPPWGLWPLAWVCLIPWFFALESLASSARPTTQYIRQGFWLGYWVSVIGFPWVYFVLKEFSGLPGFVGVIGLLLFGFIGQPQFLILAPTFKKLTVDGSFNTGNNFVPQDCLRSLVFALIYAGVDAVLPKFFTDTLGHAFFQARHLRQVADLGGAALLTFLAVFMNFGIWISIKKRHIRKFSAHAPLLFSLFLCCAAWTYGWIRNEYITQKIANAPQFIQVAGIQGNIGDLDKLASEFGVATTAKKVVQTFLDLSDQALHLNPKPELLIWPETAFPTTFLKPQTKLDVQLSQQINEYFQAKQIPIFFGGYDHNFYRDFNAFFFLSPQSPIQTYHKNILLFLGEYIPGADLFPWIKQTFPQVGNFGRGPGPEVFDVSLNQNKTIRIAPVICYEALFPNYVIESARRGSQVIMNITNDSWYGNLGEPELHLALSTFRSIETRLPLVRITNTGISAVILPDGEVTAATAIGVEAIMNARVPLIEPTPTLLVHWGNWFGVFALVLGGVVMCGNALMHYFRSRVKT